MARLQILELPVEHHGDDMVTPFVLVIDQYEPPPFPADVDAPGPFDHIAEKIGARAVLAFEETVEIPANAPIPVPDDPEHAGTTQIVYAHERTRLDLCNALLVSGDTTWRKLVEEVEQRQTAVISLSRVLDAHKVALLDALGMDRTRDWDDIRNAAAGLRKQRDAQAEAVERVRSTSTKPEVMDAQQEHPGVWKHGYHCGVLAAKSALRPRDEPTVKP